MSSTLDVVLLLALPASGKSEVRNYLASLDADECRKGFHLGQTVQLDDYPYVHMMRRVDDELAALGAPRVFFQAADRPFRDPADWGTLIVLLNEDFADLTARPVLAPASAARWLFGRIDAAARRVGAEVKLSTLPAGTLDALAGRLETEAHKVLADKVAGWPEALAGKTVVIEFARGGADGSPMPLPAPFGYRHSLSLLAPAILERASILYVWVEPAESRRKNRAREKPGRDGDASILNHGVPIAVMMEDYGCDDMAWLIGQSDRPDTVRLEAHGRTWHLPVARFDNRVDRTSFAREPRDSWSAADVRALHDGLREGFERLARATKPS